VGVFDEALYDVFRGELAPTRGEVVWNGAQGCCGAIGERTGGGEPVAGASHDSVNSIWGCSYGANTRSDDGDWRGQAAVYERVELGKGTGGGAGEVDAGGAECQGKGCGAREV
jgi:hypothetical protein